MLIHRNRPKPPQKPRTWPEGKPKPTLPMTQVPIFRIHYQALEEYLARVYHMQEYDFIRATGAVAGMTPEYTVQAQLPPARDAQQRADAIRLGHRTQNVPLILTVLCIDGFIPEGTYIIDTRTPTPPIDVYRALLEETRDVFDARCVEYRAQHSSNPEFKKRAALLNRAILDWLQHQEG
jgi:hypothetical protein